MYSIQACSMAQIQKIIITADSKLVFTQTCFQYALYYKATVLFHITWYWAFVTEKMNADRQSVHKLNHYWLAACKVNFLAQHIMCTFKKAQLEMSCMHQYSGKDGVCYVCLVRAWHKLVHNLFFNCENMHLIWLNTRIAVQGGFTACH